MHRILYFVIINFLFSGQVTENTAKHVAISVIKKHFKRYGFTPTQHQIADEIGKSRGAIYPRLQLLAEMGEIHFDLNGQIIMGEKQ